jgi:hypothetical protein
LSLRLRVEWFGVPQADASMAVLPSGDAIDAEWLSAQLNLGVEALEIEPLGVPQGFVSNTMRT